MPKFTIYRHVHDESGRSYIGLTKKTMMHRWNQHCAQAAANKGDWRSFFANAIRTYGKKAFSHEVLEVCTSLEEANLREQFWIWTYNTTNPLRGFNLKRGGEHKPHPVKNPWDRPEFRANQIKLAKARVISSETRQKMNASLRTPESQMKRSEISKLALSSPETKMKMSQGQRGRVFSEAHRKKLSEAMLKRPHELIEQIASKHRGKKLSTEHKQKISRSELGRILTEGTKKKISTALKGTVPHSSAFENSAKSRRNKAMEVKTHFHCKKHGLIPADLCYKRKHRKDDDLVRLMCRQCIIDYSKIRIRK